MFHSTAPESPPQLVQFFEIGVRSVNIRWDPPRNEDQNGIITYYQLVLSEKQLNLSDVVVNTTDTLYTFTNLEEYNLYYCEVAAATAAGLGPYSIAVNFTTLANGMHTALA